MKLLGCFEAFEGVLTGRFERRGVGRKLRHDGERVALDVSKYPKLFGDGTKDWSGFESDRLVLFLRRGEDLVR